MSDLLYMQRCLELAVLSKGYTAPNPMVGAVLVYEGRIIGEGRHELYGQAHAEVNCFNSVAPEDKTLIPAATLYVSLEPCAHYGKTPPCAERIIAEGVQKVVIANRDPFAKVDGRGIALLEAAGVSVTTGLLEREGHWLNRRFFTFHSRQRPYVILKWAQTAQGFFAPADRSRMQLSNGWSSRLNHRWRTEEAAIAVGTTTALQDNPQLTARLALGPQPLRIAVDRQLRIPRDYHLYDNSTPTWIINEQLEAEQEQVLFLQLPFGEALIPALLDALYQAGKTSLIVEGGTSLQQQFIQLGLWDEARIFTTSVSMDDGIAAPALHDAHPVYATQLDGDTLSVLLHKDNPYHYMPGASL